jgi:hypothetical protein
MEGAKAAATAQAQAAAAGAEPQVFYNPTTGQQQTVDVRHQPQMVQQLAAAGYQPYNQQTPQQTASADYDKVAQTEAAKALPGLATDGANIQALRSVVSSPNYKPGGGEEYIAPIRNVLAPYLGEEAVKTATAEQLADTFKGVAGIALARSTVGAGNRLDQQEVRATKDGIASLGMTPEGIRARVYFLNALNQNDQAYQVGKLQAAAKGQAQQYDAQYYSDHRNVISPLQDAAWKTIATPASANNPSATKMPLPKFQNEQQMQGWVQDIAPMLTPAQLLALRANVNRATMNKTLYATGQ